MLVYINISLSRCRLCGLFKIAWYKTINLYKDQTPICHCLSLSTLIQFVILLILKKLPYNFRRILEIAKKANKQTNNLVFSGAMVVLACHAVCFQESCVTAERRSAAGLVTKLFTKMSSSLPLVLFVPHTIGKALGARNE